VEWDKFWVDILRDIDICFIAFVHERYLVFLRRLKRGGPWVGKLFMLARRHCLLFRCLQPRRGNMVLKLRERPARLGLRALLVLEVVGEGS
jgi:hypothetical protein